MRISDWSSDVCSSDLVDAGEPALLDILGLPLFGPETHWHKWLRLLPFGEAEHAPAFVKRHGVAENPYRRIVPRVGQRLEARNPHPVGARNQHRRHGVPAADKMNGRSEKRRVGKEWVRKCRSRWPPEQKK